jgi:hypothetical protein
VSRQMFLPHLTCFRLLAHHRIDGVWHLDLSARQRSAACPQCRHRSTAVHSTYRRTVAHLPMGKTQVLLHLQVRRFFCRHAACPWPPQSGRLRGLTPRGIRCWRPCWRIPRTRARHTREYSDDPALRPSHTPPSPACTTGDWAR